MPDLSVNSGRPAGGGMKPPVKGGESPMGDAVSWEPSWVMRTSATKVSGPPGHASSAGHTTFGEGERKPVKLHVPVRSGTAGALVVAVVLLVVVLVVVVVVGGK